MSQLPNIRRPVNATSHPQPTPSHQQLQPLSNPRGLSLPSPYHTTAEALHSLMSDATLPADVKRKIKEMENVLLQHAASLPPGTVTGASSRKLTSQNGSTLDSLCTTNASPDGAWAAESVSGRAPLRHSLFCLDRRQPLRAEDIDISAVPHHRSRSASPTIITAVHSPFRRTLPALQDPTEAFEAMNRAAMQTLRYVEEANEMDFDITTLTELDGTVMVDMERLFLSVCCSIFANFSFFSSLAVDARKLVHFLGNLYTCYSEELPYHNAVHAADALQMASLFLRDPIINVFLTDEEILWVFLSVLSLDVAHPGVEDRTLAELNHPLTTIFGDAATTQQSSLLVFLHELLLEENIFFQSSWWSQRPAQAQCILRELLYEVTSGTVPRMRPFLLGELRRIARAHCIEHDDVPQLMSALTTMAHHSGAFRSRAQSLSLGLAWCAERLCEEEERERHNFESIIPIEHLEGDAAIMAVATLWRAVVQPLADAMRALVPPDLYDKLEHNCDTAALLREAGGVTPLRPGSAGPLSMWHPGLSWNDNCSLVIETLRRATMHANSLDRKASKCAILNASSQRAGTGVGITLPDWRVVSVVGRSSVNNSGVFNTSVCTDVDSRQDSPDSLRMAISPRPHPSRAEHYFSFLRLYNEFEEKGKPFTEFCGQLIFLALQLDPSYIAAYAVERFGSDGGAAQCAEMATYIRTVEEPPLTAEVIARPSKLIAEEGGSGRSAGGGTTDGFLLLLMEMYVRREEALLKTQQRFAEGDSEGRATLSPSSSSHRGGSPGPPHDPRDSPVRLPVNTDSRVVADFPNMPFH